MPEIPILAPEHQKFLPENFYYVHESRGNSGLPAMVGTPGLKTWLDLSGTVLHPVRAIRVVKGILYAVIGNAFYKIVNKNSYSSKGTISTTSGKVTMIDNGEDIMFSVLGVSSYNYDIATETLSEISDSDLPALSSLTYQDTYAIGVAKDTAYYYICASGDFTDWDPLDYETARRFPDLLVGGKTLNGELWMLGEYSGEVYQNTGASSFPFEKIQGVDMEVGLSSVDSLETLDNSLFFLDNNGQVRRTQGYSTSIISTEEIEEIIANMSTISDAIGERIHYRTSWWYVLSFPSGNMTLIYDITASAKVGAHVWYKWSSYPNRGRHRMNCLVTFKRKYLVGDYDAGIIWELDDNTYHENGNELFSELTFPIVPDGGVPSIFENFRLGMKTGVGLINDLAAPTSGSKPVVAISYSDDGGQNFVAQTYESMGKFGESYKTIIRHNMGMTKGQGRIMRALVTDPVERVVRFASFNEEL